jgi:hypothetical protein
MRVLLETMSFGIVPDGQSPMAACKQFEKLLALFKQRMLQTKAFTTVGLSI